MRIRLQVNDAVMAESPAVQAWLTYVEDQLSRQATRIHSEMCTEIALRGEVNMTEVLRRVLKSDAEEAKEREADTGTRESP